MTTITPPDLELWLTGHLRTRLTHMGLGAARVQVGNKEPDDPWPTGTRLVIVRDDSGPQLSTIHYARSVGVTVIAGTRRDDQPAGDLARLVYGILTEDPGIIQAPGSPIASIEHDECRGPWAVTEPHDAARRYMTIAYTVTGHLADTERTNP